MNCLILALATFVAAQDPYQSIGQEVGSVYQRIGALVSASMYNDMDIRSAQYEAENVVESLRQQIATINWEALVGEHAAAEYTSHLGDYVQDLVTVNQYLGSLITGTTPAIPAATAHASTAAAPAAAVTAPSGAAVQAVTKRSSEGYTAGLDRSATLTAHMKMASESGSASKSEHKSESKSESKSSRSETSQEKKTESSKSKTESATGAKAANASHSTTSAEKTGAKHNNAVLHGIGMGALAASIAFLI